MLRTNTIIRLFLAIFFLIPGFVFASEVVLRSGQKLEGKIVEQTDEYIKFDPGVGTAVTYNTDEVDTIDGRRLPAAAQERQQVLENFLAARNNDATTKSKLHSLSSALESYAMSHGGSYPAEATDLTSAKPPYIDVTPCGQTVSGFAYNCNFTKQGYVIAAAPVKMGVSGTTVYTIKTGDVLTPPQDNVKLPDTVTQQDMVDYNARMSNNALEQIHGILKDAKQADMGTDLALAGLAINESLLLKTKQMSLKSYPGYKAALDEAMRDPEFKKAWENKDTQSLKSNPSYKKLCSNPDVQAYKKGSEQLKAQAKEDVRRQLSGTPFEKLQDADSIPMPVVKRRNPDIQERKPMSPAEIPSYVGARFEEIFTLNDGTQIKGKLLRDAAGCTSDIVTSEGRVFRIRKCAVKSERTTGPDPREFSTNCGLQLCDEDSKEFSAKMAALSNNAQFQKAMSDPLFQMGMQTMSSRVLRTTTEYADLSSYPEFRDLVQYLDQLNAECSP